MCPCVSAIPVRVACRPSLLMLVQIATQHVRHGLIREAPLEQMLFSAADAGVVWADNGLDLTSEAIKAINAQTP